MNNTQSRSYAVICGRGQSLARFVRDCSVAVPPTLHVIFILTATLLFLLVAVAIGLEYNAAHSSVARWLSRLAVVAVGGCSRRSQSASECKRVASI